MNEMLKMDKKSVSEFFFFCFWASHHVMTDLVPEEERKTLKQYRSVTSKPSFLIVFYIALEIFAACFIFVFLLNWYWKSNWKSPSEVTQITDVAYLFLAGFWLHPSSLNLPDCSETSLKRKFQLERKRHFATPSGHFEKTLLLMKTEKRTGPKGKSYQKHIY